MLNFLRKLRRNNMNGKYFKYAFGEILLVVVGILVALSVNNWNEQRKEQKLSKLYIDRVEKDLDQLIISSKELIDRNRAILTAITETQTFLERGTSLSSEETEVFEYALTYFPRTTYQLPHMLTYEEMKENGKINLIYNQTLRTELAEFYNYLQQIEALYFRLGSDTEDQFTVYNRFINSRVDPSTLEISYDYNFEAMTKDRELINTFSRLSIHWRGFTFFMEGVNSRGNELMRLFNEIKN